MSRIMVVDDYEPNLLLYAAVVRRVIGEEPLAFENPTEALRSLKHERPQLVVVDYQMPEMNGIAFIQALRRMDGHTETPIIMLTAVSDRSVRTKAMLAGATLFLEKPLSLNDFTAYIRRFTGDRQPVTAAAFGDAIDRVDERRVRAQVTLAP